MTQPNASEKKSKNYSFGTIKRLLSYVAKDYKLKFSLVLFFILLSSGAGVAGSVFLRSLIDDYIVPMIGVPNPVFTKLLKALTVMAVIYTVGAISTYVYNLLMVMVGQGVQKHIRDEMFIKMEKLPIKYFDTHPFGDVMSRYTNDIDTLRQMLSQSLPNMFASSITMVFVFCAMLYTSVPLTLIILVMVFITVKVSSMVAGKSRKYFVFQQESLGGVNGYIEEMVSGQKVIKVFSHEKETEKQFDRINEDLFTNASRANRYANSLMPLTGNLGNLNYVAISIIGGMAAINGIGSLTLGAIISFLQLTRSFNQPIGQMSQQLNSVIMALAGAQRIFEMMDEEPEVDKGNVTLVMARYDMDGNIIETNQRTDIWAWKVPHKDGTTTYTKLEGDVQFFDVDFSYDGKKTVLFDISLYAKPGQKVAFVGATGAGKTTITNLINRFYDIADGKIKYDGININRIKKNDLRRSLGIVLQDVNLFSDTVMENIRYGNLNASDEEVIAASKLVGADSFIARLPDGYNTMLEGAGSGLSQGQRQLISIARAAVADPPVMILDEATSSIDTRTEEQVQKGMDALMSGRTVFVIAHRLSTIRNSDVIIVLDKGYIVERGTHDELLAQRGKYYQLYTGAFETVDEMEEEKKEEQKAV